MSLAHVLQNLGAAWVQGVLVAAAALLAAELLPVERPRWKLLWWQAALVLTLALPLVVPGIAPAAAARAETELLAIGPALAASRGALGSRSGAEVVALVLAAGCIFGFARLLVGLGRLRAFAGRASALLPADAGALAGWADALGVPATFLVSNEAGGSATFGVLHPTVLLPPAFLAMDAELRRAVALHELLHVRRRDWLFTLVEEALRALFWFQPAVHALVARSRLCREQCVDAAVVDALGGRETYLEALVEMARVSVLRPPLPAALLLREHHLRARIELLLKEATMTKLRNLVHLGGGALFLLLAGALAAWSFPLEDTKGPPPAKPADTKAEKKEIRGAGPRVLHRVDPTYPEAAKKAGIDGDVVMEIRIAKTGEVAEARVVRGPEALADAALAAMRQWKFEPPVGPDKKPSDVTATITMRFSLD